MKPGGLGDDDGGAGAGGEGVGGKAFGFAAVELAGGFKEVADEAEEAVEAEGFGEPGVAKAVEVGGGFATCVAAGHGDEGDFAGDGCLAE